MAAIISAERMPTALKHAGQLVGPLGQINQAVDQRLRGAVGYSQLQFRDYFLKVWMQGGRYCAEVWTCQRYQQTIEGEIQEIMAEADERWSEEY